MGLFGRKRVVTEEIEPEAPSLAPPAPGPGGRRAWEDQRDWVVSMIEPLAPLGVGLLDAAGLTLCEDIRAYDVRPARALAETTGFGIDVTGLLAASSPGGGAAAAGMVSVVAGEPLPAGIDTVVPAWLTRTDATGVLRVVERVRRGDWVRAAGADSHDGEVLAGPGTVVTPLVAARLAAAGFDRVLARPRVRVAVLALGSGGTSGPDGGAAASYLLTMALRDDGATAWRLGVDGESAEAVREAIENELIRADLLVCCGGLETAAGALPGVLDEVGLADVAEVAMEPGGRQGFALVGEAKIPLLAVPGQPVGAAVSYLAFVRPVLNTLAGAPVAPEAAVSARSAAELPVAPDITQFVCGRLGQHEGQAVVQPLAARPSGGARDLAGADALIVVPGGTAPVRAGESVRCWPLHL